MNQSTPFVKDADGSGDVDYKLTGKPKHRKIKKIKHSKKHDFTHTSEITLPQHSLNATNEFSRFNDTSLYQEVVDYFTASLKDRKTKKHSKKQQHFKISEITEHEQQYSSNNSNEFIPTFNGASLNKEINNIGEGKVKKKKTSKEHRCFESSEIVEQPHLSTSTDEFTPCNETFNTKTASSLIKKLKDKKTKQRKNSSMSECVNATEAIEQQCSSLAVPTLHDSTNCNQEISSHMDDTENNRKTEKKKHSKKRHCLETSKVVEEHSSINTNEFSPLFSETNVKQGIHDSLNGKIKEKKKKRKHCNEYLYVETSKEVEQHSSTYANEFTPLFNDTNFSQESNNDLNGKVKKKRKHSNKDQCLEMSAVIEQHAPVNRNKFTPVFSDSNFSQEINDSLTGEIKGKRTRKSKHLLKHQYLEPSEITEQTHSYNSTNKFTPFINEQINGDLSGKMKEKKKKKNHTNERQGLQTSEITEQQHSLPDTDEFTPLLGDTSFNQEINDSLTGKRKKKKHSKETSEMTEQHSSSFNINEVTLFSDSSNFNQQINGSLIGEIKDKTKKKKRSKDRQYLETSEITEQQHSAFDTNEVTPLFNGTSFNQEVNDNVTGEIRDKNKRKKKKHSEQRQYLETSEATEGQYSLNNMNEYTACFSDTNCNPEMSDSLIGKIQKKKAKKKKHSRERQHFETSEVTERQSSSNKIKEFTNPFNDAVIRETDNNVIKGLKGRKKKKECNEYQTIFEVTEQQHSVVNATEGIDLEEVDHLNLDEPPERNEIERQNNSYFYSNHDEEFLDFDLPPLHEKESIALRSKDIEEFKSRGIAIETGKWSKSEESLLKRNYNEIAAKYGINDPCFFFGIGKGQRSKDTAQFVKNTHFYARLGRDLNERTLRSIYMKARNMFHPFNDKGKADEDEVSYLLEKQRQIGNKWTQIGINMDRGGKNCLAVHRWHEKGIKNVKWSQEEVEMLKQAIERVAGTSDFSDMNAMQNISWTKIAELVPSRNFSQCRHYWAEHLAWDSSVVEKKKWNKSCFAKLISLLKNNYYVKEESKVDWKKIQESFKDVSPSYFFLQKRWRYLKSRVPKGMSYRETIDFLCEQYKNIIHALSVLE